MHSRPLLDYGFTHSSTQRDCTTNSRQQDLGFIASISPGVASAYGGCNVCRTPRGVGGVTWFAVVSLTSLRWLLMIQVSPLDSANYDRGGQLRRRWLLVE